MADAPLFEPALPTLDTMDMSGAPPFDLFEFNTPIDSTPPIVTNIVPAPGVQLSRFQTVSCRITDTGLQGFRRIQLWAYYPGVPIGTKEMIHDGVSFTARYVNSTRTPVTDGFDYVLNRTTGWPAPLTIGISAIDMFGYENL